MVKGSGRMFRGAGCKYFWLHLVEDMLSDAGVQTLLFVLLEALPRKVLENFDKPNVNTLCSQVASTHIWACIATTWFYQ